jgi:hypothetical protein
MSARFKTWSRTANAYIEIDRNVPVQFKKRDKKVFWESTPGSQTLMLQCKSDEVLAGGERGSGMTQGLLAWFAMGDSGLPVDDPAHYSYLLDSSFRGLLLSAYDFSLTEELLWMFGPLGGRLSEAEGQISFPSGAKILYRDITTSIRKLRGPFTKIGIDRLCDFPKERRYLSLLALLRNSRPSQNGNQVQPLFCQILSTAIPTGPGVDWVRKRFIELKDPEGCPIAPERQALDTYSKLSRTYIHMRIEENPYLRDNQQYRGMMQAQEETLRRAWMNGDWTAFSQQEGVTCQP